MSSTRRCCSRRRAAPVLRLYAWERPVGQPRLPADRPRLARRAAARARRRGRAAGERRRRGPARGRPHLRRGRAARHAGAAGRSARQLRVDPRAPDPRAAAGRARCPPQRSTRAGRGPARALLRRRDRLRGRARRVASSSAARSAARALRLPAARLDPTRGRHRAVPGARARLRAPPPPGLDISAALAARAWSASFGGRSDDPLESGGAVARRARERERAHGRARAAIRCSRHRSSQEGSARPPIGRRSEDPPRGLRWRLRSASEDRPLAFTPKKRKTLEAAQKYAQKGHLRQGLARSTRSS